MDRNVDPDADSLTDDVALRKESVDRNSFLRPSRVGKNPSLSARRAWIEMKVLIFGRASKPPSLSARRAWIEISTTGRGRLACGVALRKESVDRNSTYVIRLPRCQGRSPQGERG